MQAKKEILSILEKLFKDRFITVSDKEHRIIWGDQEIKVTLTTAKNKVGGASCTPANVGCPPTDEEIAEVRDLIKELNL